MLKTEIVYFLPKAIDREGMIFKGKMIDISGRGLPTFIKFTTIDIGEYSITIAP